jgi:hypothetical protein
LTTGSGRVPERQEQRAAPRARRAVPVVLYRRQRWSVRCQLARRSAKAVGSTCGCLCRCAVLHRCRSALSGFVAAG